MKTAFYLAYFFTLTCCFKTQAQSYNFRNYTANDGLASNETYYSLQASDGYLYISTDRGLQRFDGKQFTTLLFSDSTLNGSTVFKIYEDVNQKLWVTSYRKGLFYLESDTLKPFKHNAALLNVMRFSFIDQFFFETTGDLYFTTMNNSKNLYHFHTDSILEILSFSDHLTEHYPENAKQVYFKNNTVFSKRAVYDFDSIQSLGSLRSFSVKSKKENTTVDFYTRGEPCILYKDSILVGVKNVLLIYSNKGEYIDEYSFGHQILHLSINADNQILVTTAKGFYRIKNNKKIEYSFPNYPINGITQDNENGYWITTITHGLLYISSFDVNVLTEGERAFGIKKHKNHLLISSFDKKLYSFYVEGSTIKKDTSFLIEPSYRGVYLDDSIIGVAWQNYSITNSEIKPTDKTFPPGKKYIHLEDTMVLTALNAGAHYFSLNSPDKLTPLIDTLYLCHALYKNDTHVYLGSDNGLIQYSRKSGEHKIVLPKVLNQVITDIDALSDSLILVTTKTNGLFIIQDSSYTHLTANNSPLLSSGCSSIAIENNSTFWIGTDLGICKIEHTSTGFKCTSVSEYTGLISQKVNDIEIINNLLFVATDEGSCYMNTQDFKPKNHPILIKAKVALENIEAQHGDTIWLKPGIRNLMLNITAVTFKHIQHLTYKYEITGEQSTQTPSNTLYISKLNPGSNGVKINIANSNGVWNKQALQLVIIAPPYFYEKALFRIVAFLLLFILIIGIVFAFFNYFYQKKLRKWKFSTMQLRELNLQLNPHFIFNAINNINHLALSGNAKEINNFISRFSRLTRKVLDNSKFKVISLAEELENSKDYIELEKLRFRDQAFDFNLEISKEINLNREFIPPMILQPCIENAIWHGLLPKDGHRILSLQVTKIKSGFQILVMDNGVGLMASEERKLYVKSKTSVGVRNTQLRLKLYEEMEMGKSSFELREILDDDKKPNGVMAEFKFLPNPKKGNIV